MAGDDGELRTFVAVGTTALVAAWRLGQPSGGPAFPVFFPIPTSAARLLRSSRPPVCSRARAISGATPTSVWHVRSARPAPSEVAQRRCRCGRGSHHGSARWRPAGLARRATAARRRCVPGSRADANCQGMTFSDIPGVSYGSACYAVAPADDRGGSACQRQWWRRRLQVKRACISGLAGELCQPDDLPGCVPRSRDQ